uniref:Uncharacterized protein n=1 Tax=Schistocephalus solidus TaxID=70667 RepID=A0A0X3PRW7_SCHSO
MMRKVVVLAILANLALADVWLSPVETDKSGRQYITFDGKRYDLRDGESPVETLVWKDCVVELDLSRTPNTPYENYRQGSRVCKSMMIGIPDEEWKAYETRRLGRTYEANSQANSQPDV